MSDWAECLRAKDITVIVNGWVIYKHLGSGFQHFNAVKDYFQEEDRLSALDASHLVSLSSVKSFELKPEVNADVDVAVIGLIVGSMWLILSSSVALRASSFKLSRSSNPSSSPL